jgi:hypothetical protein
MIPSEVCDIDGGISVEHRFFSHVLDRVGSEYLVESKDHDPFREHSRIPPLQPDLTSAMNLVMIGANNNGEAWAQVRGVEVAFYDSAGAVVELFSLAHLRSSEERIGCLEILNYEHPVRRGLREAHTSAEEKGSENFQHSNHLTRVAISDARTIEFLFSSAGSGK